MTCQARPHPPDLKTTTHLAALAGVEGTLLAAARKRGWHEDPSLGFSAVTDDEIAAARSQRDGKRTGVTDPGGSVDRFVFVPASIFAVRTHPQWLIKNVLPRAGLGVMYGESGSGKTFKVLDMVLHVALGLPWRGNAVRQGPVRYIAAEGASGLRNRLVAYATHHDQPLDALPIRFLPAAPNFLDAATINDLTRSILADGPAALIVIDTLSQVMPGGNENAGEDMGLVVHHCRHLHEKTGALVLLVHHSGKDAARGARGWSGLRAACDVEMEVTRFEDNRVLKMTKQKDGEDGREYGFKLETVTIGQDEELEPITSCVVIPGEASKVKKSKAIKGGEMQRLVLGVVLDKLRDGNVADQNDVLEEVINRIAYTPVKGKKDRRKASVQRVMLTLQDEGRLEIDGQSVRIPVE